MSLFEVLVAPGAAIGCVVGIGAAAALHLLFPDSDLLYLQVIVVIMSSVAGHVIEHWITDRTPRR